MGGGGGREGRGEYSDHFIRVRKSWEKRLLASSRPSGWNNSAPNGRVFMKFDIFNFFFRKSVGKIQF